MLEYNHDKLFERCENILANYKGLIKAGDSLISFVLPESKKAELLGSFKAMHIKTTSKPFKAGAEKELEKSDKFATPKGEGQVTQKDLENAAKNGQEVIDGDKAIREEQAVKNKKNSQKTAVRDGQAEKESDPSSTNVADSDQKANEDRTSEKGRKLAEDTTADKKATENEKEDPRVAAFQKNKKLMAAGPEKDNGVQNSSSNPNAMSQKQSLMDRWNAHTVKHYENFKKNQMFWDMRKEMLGKTLKPFTNFAKTPFGSVALLGLGACMLTGNMALPIGALKGAVGLLGLAAHAHPVATAMALGYGASKAFKAFAPSSSMAQSASGYNPYQATQEAVASQVQAATNKSKQSQRATQKQSSNEAEM